MKIPLRRFILCMFSLLAIVLLVLTCVLHQYERPQKQITELPVSVSFVTAPRKPLVRPSNFRHASKVPLLVGKHRLYIWATFGKQKRKCVLDTGGCGTIWPRRLGLAHTSETFKASVTDAGGKTLSGEGRILQQVQIGTYFLDELPSFAHSSHSHSDLLALPVLGNNAFEDTVLTLDCRNKQMEIRQHGLPLSASGHKSGTILLTFAKRGAYAHVYPCVMATLEHQKVHLLLDTGWTHEAIGITPKIYANLLPAFTARHLPTVMKHVKFLAGKHTTQELQSVQWTLGNVSKTSKALVIPHLQPGIDAVCGLPLFLHNRVTIDYPHGEVLLEPYE